MARGLSSAVCYIGSQGTAKGEQVDPRMIKECTKLSSCS